MMEDDEDRYILLFLICDVTMVSVVFRFFCDYGSYSS